MRKRFPSLFASPVCILFVKYSWNCFVFVRENSSYGNCNVLMQNVLDVLTQKWLKGYSHYRSFQFSISKERFPLLVEKCFSWSFPELKKQLIQCNLFWTGLTFLYLRKIKTRSFCDVMSCLKFFRLLYTSLTIVIFSFIYLWKTWDIWNLCLLSVNVPCSQNSVKMRHFCRRIAFFSLWINDQNIIKTLTKTTKIR